MILPVDGFRPRPVCPACRRPCGPFGHYSAELRAFRCALPPAPPPDDGHADGSLEASAEAVAFLPWVVLAVALGIALALWLLSPSVPPLPR